MRALTLGLVGIVPQRKRLDLALDVLERLLETRRALSPADQGQDPRGLPMDEPAP